MSDPAAGYCNVSGCYYPIEGGTAKWEWNSNSFDFGYGDTYIGSGTAYATWILNGGQMKEQPVRFNLSSPASRYHFSGALMRGGPGSDHGGVVLSTCLESGGGPAAAYTLFSWQVPGHQAGCAEYDNAFAYHNMVVEMSWRISGYGGYWYTWVHSPVAYSQSPSTGRYKFYVGPKLVSPPYGSGYNANG